MEKAVLFYDNIDSAKAQLERDMLLPNTHQPTTYSELTSTEEIAIAAANAHKVMSNLLNKGKQTYKVLRFGGTDRIDWEHKDGLFLRRCNRI